MTCAGATIGAWDVVDRFVAIYEAHLQAKLDELVADAKVKDPTITWALYADAVIKGSNEDPRQRANTVMVFEDSAIDDVDQLQNYGGPIRQTVTVWTRANVMDRKVGVDDLDEMRSIYGTAIKSVLMEHWRADDNPAHLYSCRVRAMHGVSSRRRTRGVFGTVANRLGFGGGGQDTIDPIRVVAVCGQFREQPIQL